MNKNYQLPGFGESFQLFDKMMAAAEVVIEKRKSDTKGKTINVRLPRRTSAK